MEKKILILLGMILLLGIVNAKIDSVFDSTVTDCKDTVIYTHYDETCLKESLLGNGTTICVEVRLDNTWNRTRCIKDGTVNVNGRIISYPGRWCVINQKYSDRIDCVQIHDGLHRNDPYSFKGCQDEGGMDCIIHKFDDKTHYDISIVNSDKYIL